MKYISKFIRNPSKKAEFLILLFIFFLAIFEPIRWPFFYPATTWGIMKGLLLLFLLWTFWSKTKRDFFRKNYIIFLPALLFFLANLLSIFKAVDSQESLKSISYLLVGILFFILSFIYLENRKQILSFFKMVLYLSAIVGFTSFTTLIFPDFFRNLWVLIFPGDTMERYFLNLNRGRIEPLWAIQMGFPIVVYLLITQWQAKKRLINFFIFLLAILAITFSNNRYQFVSALAASFGYLLFTRSKKFLAQKRAVFLFLVVIIILASLASGAFLGRNILERIFFLDYWQDVDPLVTRFNLAKQALEMFVAHPVFGIGLSNFIYYLEPEYSFEREWTYGNNYLNFLYYETPHNIFLQLLAETGLVGLLLFIFVLRNFLKQDFALLRTIKNENFKMIVLAIIFSSWIYILDNLTSIVSTSATSLVYFWFVRGVLAAIYHKKIRGDK